MVHVSQEQTAKLQRVLCRAQFTSPSSYSCYSRWSESQGKRSLAHCCDLYPFSFLPSHLCPVAVLLSQMSSQKMGPVCCSGSALCWSMELSALGTRACSHPQGWGLQPQPFPVLTSSRCSAPGQYQWVWSGGLAATTSTARSLTLSQHSCSQRTLLTVYSALIQHNRAHDLNFQSPAEHLINDK